MSDRRIPMVAEVQPVAEAQPAAEESYGTAVMRKTKKKHTGLAVFLCLTCVLLATWIALSEDHLGLQPSKAQPPADNGAAERELIPNAAARLPSGATGQNAPWLGFAVGEIPQSYCVYYGFPGTVWITQIDTGTCADGVLSEYDVVVSVDGVSIATAEDYAAQLSAHEPGDILELRIFRTGCYYKIRLPLMGN